MRTETIVRLQLAHNVQIPILKGIFGNMNTRFINTPWTKYIENSQNMIVELGLGYDWQRKQLQYDPQGIKNAIVVI